MIKEAIGKLVNGDGLTLKEIEAAKQEIVDNEATPVQEAAFLTALKLWEQERDRVKLSPEDTDRLAQMTVKWALAKTERYRLRGERAACICVEESNDDPETGSRGGPPCWKYADRGAEEPEGQIIPQPQDPEDWCDPCKKRQKIHEEYVAARDKSAGLQAALLRVARRLGQPKEGA